MFVPRTMGHQTDLEGITENESEFKRWSSIAEETGFEHRWNLSGTFDDYEEVLQIQLAEWDTHPNAVGHDLLGQKFYEVMVQNMNVLESEVQSPESGVGQAELSVESAEGGP